jgi:hypothetical protein
MAKLFLRRCRNHSGREAAVCCPSCRQYFCRECVTEHEGRLLCVACLPKSARGPLFKRRGFARAFQLFQCLAAFVAAWFFFYLIGEALIALPSSFHEGNVWRTDWLDAQ